MGREDRSAEIRARLSFVPYQTMPDGKKASDQRCVDFERQFLDLGLSYPEAATTAATVNAYTYGLHIPLDAYRGKRILDAGCGEGRLKFGLNTLGMDAHVTNFDDLSESRRGNIDVVGKIEDMRFADNTFDIVVARSTYPFFLDETVDPNYMAQQLKELVRVTNRGGSVRYRPFRMFSPHVNRNAQDIMDRITERAVSVLAELYEANPGMEIKITRALQDDGVSYDELLEIVK